MSDNYIPWMSEMPSDYCKAIRKAKTADELRAQIAKFADFVPDAVAQAASITWEDWQRGFILSQVDSWEAAEEAHALVGDIMMPALFIQISVIADQFKAPFGVTFNRCLDAGKIARASDGIYYIVK